MEEERENLRRLEEDTETIISTLSPTDIDGAINWGDLHCVEALLIMNKDGLEYYQVCIEEASPDNHDLHNAVYEQLVTKYGWLSTTEVVTEW